MQDAPLLRGGLVVRQRLRDVLTPVPGIRLILVSAPAGFGKTTLIADWVRATGIGHAWVSLSPVDDDPVRFARRVLEAAAGSAGRPPYEVPATATLDDSLAAVVGALEEGPNPMALVLDDGHVLGPAVNELVGRLLERLPPGILVILGTRADPPLPLSRLRAGGQLIEVRASALRFTAEEAERFLRETIGLAIEPGQAAALQSKTEGWAAGLQLAGLALRDRPANHAFVEQFSGTNRFVLDYLVDEVLTLQPDAVQEFLVTTSILDRMSGELCEAVTRQRGGQAMLERLERDNLFVVPLDEERSWYRYHRLFADLLRARLRRDRRADEATLHSRAAAWLRDHGEADEAIGHALAAGDVALAVDIVGEHWVPYGHRGEVATVRRWLDALPPEIVRGDALLSAAYAWMLVLAGHHDEAEPRLRDAECASGTHIHGTSPAWLGSVAAQVALMRSSVAMARGAAVEASEQATLALDSIPPDLQADLASVLRGESGLTLGHALASLGELDRAAAAYRAALPLLWEGGNPFAVAMGAMRLADTELKLDRHAAALETCLAVLHQADGAHLGDAPAMAAVHLALGRVLLASDDRAAAEREAMAGRDLARRGGQVTMARMAEQLLETVRATTAVRAGRNASSPPEPLTTREMDVLRLLVAGRSNRQIADELFLSVGTIKFHVHAVLGKLGAESRLDAVARARSSGLVD